LCPPLVRTIFRPMMRLRFSFCALAFALLVPARFAWTDGDGKSSAKIPEDEKIWDYMMHHRKEMVRVTEQPFHVLWFGASLCQRPNTIPHTPHGEHWIHVFISPNGVDVMKSGKGVYPEGTIILKEKFKDEAGEKTEFFTGMRKSERGYNPESGDWEYFTLDARGDTVTARGKIESCMDCHAKFRKTDFVARVYLRMKEHPGALDLIW
jgi:Cytochrome P460